MNKPINQNEQWKLLKQAIKAHPMNKMKTNDETANAQAEDAIISPLLREWTRLKRAEVEFESNQACLDALSEALKRESRLKASIHAAHGLLAPMWHEFQPSIAAIREATLILRNSL